MKIHLSRRSALKFGACLLPASWLSREASAQEQVPVAKDVQLIASDGHKFSAFLAEPVGAPKGGIVILHAVYGLVPSMRDVCARWAQAGYTAVAPALFDRIRPNTIHPYTRDGVQAGSGSYNALSEAQIFDDIMACVDRAGGEGQTAISGFCTGGSWAWRASSKKTFAAHVNFYGSHVATPEYIGLEPLCRTIIHYGDKDAVVSLPDTEKIRQKHPSVEMFIHPGAGHAFMNPDQETYHAQSAQQAWSQSIAFMDKHVGSKKG